MIGTIITIDEWNNSFSYGSNKLSVETDVTTAGTTLTLKVPQCFTKGIEVPFGIYVQTSLRPFTIEFSGFKMVHSNTLLTITYESFTRKIPLSSIRNDFTTIYIYPHCKDEFADVEIFANNETLLLNDFFKQPATTFMGVKVTTSETGNDISLSYSRDLADLAVFGNFTKCATAGGGVASRDMFVGAEKAPSTDILQAFEKYLVMKKPRVAVWQAGMYESDSGTTVNATWKANMEAFLTLCKSNNIMPVVCTMPNAPGHDHIAKNTYLRTLADARVNDVAMIVNRTEEGNYWPMKAWSVDDDAPSAHGYWILSAALNGCHPYIS